MMKLLMYPGLGQIISLLEDFHNHVVSDSDLLGFVECEELTVDLQVRSPRSKILLELQDEGTTVLRYATTVPAHDLGLRLL